MNLKILSYKEIKEISSDCNVIPVCKPILADIETPVSIWKKLYSSEKHSFLLESVSGGETVARYSFWVVIPF